MPSLAGPSRLFSFANWQRTQPRAQLPGDRLDAQILDVLVNNNQAEEIAFFGDVVIGDCG
jgi:hypothetical protein